MKKTTFYLIIINFVWIITCISCANTEMGKSEEVIIPVIPDDGVIAFFEEYLPRPQPSISLECFFFNKEDMEDKCVIINNVDGFKKAFSCSSDMLPVIDFDSHTLIIGQHRVNSICHYVIEQNIIVESQKLTLNIDMSCPNGYYTAFGTLYYWGIYPKIQDKSVSVKIRFKIS